MKYRNDKIEGQMLLVEFLLTAISEQSMSKLGVLDFTKEDATMPMEKAIRLAMRDTANKSMVATKALAICLDRVVAMAGQMAEEMNNANLHGHLYQKRIEVLTNFASIMDELNPEMANRFAQM